MKIYTVFVCILLCGSGVEAFRMRKSLYGFESTLRRLVKRDIQHPGGTCTCTCETKALGKSMDHGYNDIYSHDSPISLRTGLSNKETDNNNYNDNDDIENEISRIDTTESVSKNGSTEYGHKRRFPWQDLPDRECYRNHCRFEGDCCRNFNICDKSANTCIDCWHGMICNSEENCCMRFPYCKKSKNPNDSSGRCVEEIN